MHLTPGTHNDGSLSPTLLEMKTSMKRLQKDLSELRSRFESYIQDRSGINRSKPLPPSSAPVQKRKHESESEEEGNEDQPSSSKKLNTENKEEDKSKFKVDSDGFLIVYTDGSCWMNGKHGAKAGMGVFFGQDHPLWVAIVRVWIDC